jgi:hypothetical protein
MAATPEVVFQPSPQRAAPDAARRRERLFFGGMVAALVLTVFAGFAPSFYLHGVSGAANALTPSLVLHGIVFSAWMVLLFAQTSLIAARRTDLHRRLGVVGAVLAVLMMVLGAYVAVTRAQEGLLTPPAFLAIPLATLIVFPALFGAALYFRRRPDIHKRLVLLATLELVTAAIARLPLVAPHGPIAFFAVTDLFLVAIVVYDLVSLKRVHAATLWGGLLLIASQPLRLLISETEAWIAFTGWIAG